MSTIKTIGTLGFPTRDFSDPSSWLLSFAAGGWIGEGVNDGEFLVTSPINFSGQATSAVNFITLRTASGQSFADHASRQTNPLRYDQSKGVGIRCNTFASDTIQIAEDYVTLQGLQLSHTNSAQTINNNSTSTSHCLIDSCIVETVQSNKWRSGKLTNTLWVCRYSGGDGVDVPYSNITAVNCTFVRPSNFTAGGRAVADSGTSTFKNCVFMGFTSIAAGSPTGSNNCADIAIPFGTSNQASKTFSAQFVTTTDTGRDFRVAASGSALIPGNGVVDTTNIPSSLDIVGTARGTSWGIGAWQLAASGPTYTLALGQGAYALTGQNVVMLFNRKLTLAQGSYSLTGKAVGLLRGFKLSLGQGAYVLTGQSLGLLFNRKLSLGQGSYALTGQNLNLLRKYVLTLGQGTYSLTGKAINIVWSGVAAATYTFALACGSYALNGQAVSLLYGRRLLMASGVYNLTGNPVSLLFNRKLSLGQGTYNLTGQAVGLLRGFKLALASGSYALAGQAMAFKRSYVLQLANGVYSLTGQALNIVRQGAAVFGYTPRFAFKAEPRNRTFKAAARKRSNKE